MIQRAGGFLRIAPDIRTSEHSVTVLDRCEPSQTLRKIQESMYLMRPPGGVT